MSEIVERLKSMYITHTPSASYAQVDPVTIGEAADEITRLEARVVELEGVLTDVDAECTAAIGYEPIPKGYTAHEDVPNGLRTVSHIKLSMIQGYVRAAITKDTADE
jgi:hypothetical protein